MTLNIVWLGLFGCALITALSRLAQGDLTVFPAMLDALFASARTGFEVAFGLVGVMALWLGLLRIGQQAGAIDWLARAMGPALRRLFPEVPAQHPAQGAMTMNLAANLLGLDNAATPLGLAAMRELQTLNRTPDTASNAQIMFLVLNTAGLTLIPVSVMAVRQTLALKQGLVGFQAADLFLPTLLCSLISLFSSLLAVAWVQRIALWRGKFPLGLAMLIGMLGLMLWGLQQLTAQRAAEVAALTGSLCIFGLIAAFLTAAAWRRVPVFDTFVDGAKEGFEVAVRIVPYLVAMLAAIAVFRGAGCMDWLVGAIGQGIAALGWDTRFVPALPIGLMKTLSGSGARALMIDVMTAYGVDSFEGKLAAIIQGSTETTFYVLAVYFGSVGIKKTRHALACGLFADTAGLVGAILVAYLFFS